MEPELLGALKVLSDASRLRLIGMLAGGRSMAVEELARALSLTPGTVAHHLKRLREVGLVESHPRPPYVEYSLRLHRLGEIGRELHRMAAADDPDVVRAGTVADGSRPPDEDRVLRSFLRDGRLVTIPSQEKKRLVVLRFLAETVFEEGRNYQEKEVNQRLAVWHADVAALRRYLVDSRFMERGGGLYRLLPREAWPEPA